MALTFPDPNNTTIYVDPTSGLKYVFNAEVGAWESAIQPPVIVTNSAPDIDLTGFLWYDQTNSVTKIRLGDEWISLNPILVEDPDTGDLSPVGVVKVSTEPPPNPTPGELWWDSSLGRLFIYFVDESPDAQWLEASPNIDGINGGIAFSGPNPPTGATEGELWYNTQTGELYVFFNGGWNGIKSVIDGVETLSTIEPIYLDPGSTAKNPIVAIRDSSSDIKGAVRLATGNEASNPTTDPNAASVALTPVSLQNVLNTTPDTYISEATTSKKGIVQLATVAQSEAGQSSSVVVTPEGLGAALTASGNSVPVGTIIMFANGRTGTGDANNPTNKVPNGYLVCDGGEYEPSAYPELYDVIGIIYGSGSGGRFKVPDTTGSGIGGVTAGVYLIKT